MELIKCIHYDSGNYLWCSGQVKNKTNYRTQSAPTGIVLHSTGEGTVALKRYVQPSKSDPNYDSLIATIGRNKYSNSWNRPGVKKGVHYMIGQKANGEIAVAQMLPETFACWGCGAGKKGSYNYYPTQHIQIEMQDGNNDKFDIVYAQAVELCADICKRYKWLPTVIVSHKEAHAKGYASNHADCDAWFAKHGKTMNQFRADVELAMKDPEPTPVPPLPYYPSVGEQVKFVGKKQYTNANQVEAKGKAAIPCVATVRRIYRLGKSKHPYNVYGKGVKGWVDEKDVLPL